MERMPIWADSGIKRVVNGAIPHTPDANPLIGPAVGIRNFWMCCGSAIGIAAGGWVKVSSKRGFIKAVAVVTKRLRPMMIGDKQVHHVGIPLHWGFTGVAKKGYLVNALTPFVGDANTQTPEYKSFTVRVEKA